MGDPMHGTVAGRAYLEVRNEDHHLLYNCHIEKLGAPKYRLHAKFVLVPATLRPPPLHVPPFPHSTRLSSLQALLEHCRGPGTTTDRIIVM